MKQYIQITTTFRNRETAVKMANDMLDARLVADGQISEINSVFEWEGKKHDRKEFLLTMKTREPLYSKCQSFIKQNHEYKVPQIVATAITHGSTEYFNWIDEGVDVDL